MGRRTAPPHLHLGGRIYYFRMAVPQKLVPIFGRRLYKKSLGTGDYKTAVRLCRPHSVFAERYFRFVMAIRGRIEKRVRYSGRRKLLIPKIKPTLNKRTGVSVGTLTAYSRYSSPSSYLGAAAIQTIPARRHIKKR